MTRAGAQKTQQPPQRGPRVFCSPSALEPVRRYSLLSSRDGITGA